MSEIFERLSAPFPLEAISWRVGSTNKNSAKGEDDLKGQALAYIDARDVMDRLDDVCGPDGWQCRYSHANGKTVCDLGIWTPERGEWVWKADGAGDTDYEAEKGALSDAFKRAAVRWGVGRYLYGLSAPWVKIKARGKSFVIVDEENAKLLDYLKRHTDAAEWGSPGERVTLKAMLNGIRTMLNTADDVRRYREGNAGMIAQLRIKPRALVDQALDTIAETSTAKAA